MGSDNPQRQFPGGAPIQRRKVRYKFVPGEGMVPDLGPDDIDPELEYLLNEAIVDSEAELRRKRSFANVGYSALKRRR